jgi:hypothetical protein
MGDYYQIIEGAIKRIATTDDPKDVSTLLYNSNTDEDIKPNNRDHGRDILTEDVRILEQKVGALEQQLITEKEKNAFLKQSLTDIKEEKTKIEGIISEKDTTIQKLTKRQQDEAKTLAKDLAGEDEDLLGIYSQMNKEQLLTIQSKSTKDVAKKLAGEDEELLSVYSGMTPKQLNILQEKGPNRDTGFNGVGDEGADDQDDGTNPSEEEPKSYEEWKAERGGW